MRPGGADQHLVRRAAELRSATSAHISSASARPGSPVAALALPLLSTTAAARPPVAARWAWRGDDRARPSSCSAVNTRGRGDRRAVGGGHRGSGRGRRDALIAAGDAVGATKPLARR